MKKLTVLCLDRDRDKALHSLRDLGVLHVVPVQEPQGDAIERIEQAGAETRAALHAIMRHVDKATASHQPSQEPDTRDPVELTEIARGLAEKESEIQDALDALQEEHSAVAPFGDFDPARVQALADAGIAVKFYRVPGKEPVDIPEGLIARTLHQDASGRYLAVIGPGEWEVDAVECAVPRRSLQSIVDEQARRLEQLKRVQHELASLASHTGVLQQRLAALDNDHRMADVRDTMGGHGAILYLQGFCPADRVDEIRGAAASHGWGLMEEDPGPDDQVPTLVKYPAWARAIRPMFSFLGIVPGYHETDVGSSFFLFLTLFFAMIVGDAGYGLLFLILIAYFRWKLSDRAPREPFRLIAVFSVATLVWGVLTGNYFGLPYEMLPAALASLRVDWLVDQNHSMTFALLLGAIHLTLAHTWNAIEFGRDPRALAQSGWIALVWCLFFLAQSLLVGTALSMWIWGLVGFGVIAVLTGLYLKREWLDLGLFPLNFVTCFGDVMSYLRLFALGLASVKVADAFNGMAGGLGYTLAGTGAHGPMLWLRLAGAAVGMGAVLILGHGLNIILCAMSVLVHGVRLNALEFSLHKGMEWSGTAYKPFMSDQEHLEGAA